MFFTTAAQSIPSGFQRHAHATAGHALERFLAQARQAQTGLSMTQDESSYTLRFDVPGIAKEQLSIAIEGSIVRISSRTGAPRQYAHAYELPQDIDTASSEAKLEHGVLTLKLGKLVPVSRVTELPIL